VRPRRSALTRAASGGAAAVAAAAGAAPGVDGITPPPPPGAEAGPAQAPSKSDERTAMQKRAVDMQ